MGVVRLNKQQLLLLENILEKVEHMSEILNKILDRMQPNSKKMQHNCEKMQKSLGDDKNATEVEENRNVFKHQVHESFLVWEDQAVEEGVEKGATDSTKEIQNLVLQMVNQSTDEDELVEERKEKKVKLEKIMAAPTVYVPKEIPLSSVIENFFNKPIVLSQPSNFSISISCLSSINTSLYINLTKMKHMITEMHPINHDSKRLINRRCKDIFLRLVWHPPWETHAFEWPPLTVGYFLNRKEPFGQAYSVQKMNFGIHIFSHLKPTFNRAFTAKVWEVQFVDFLAKEPYIEGAELIHFVLDMIHKETKDCDYLEGFQICPSLRGGTKFGVMVWIFMGYWYQIEQLKRLKKKGYEVLFMVDAIDEYVIGQLKEYGGREGMAPKLFDEMLEVMLATYLNTYIVKRPFGFNGENDAAATARHLAGLEMYKITAGLGGSGGRPELCVWSLLSLRCGVLVSADNTGSVHFWSNQHGTLLQAHSLHKGDVNALAAAPSHNRVLSTGSNGQVILYKLSSETVCPSDDKDSSIVMKIWTYVGYVRAHTHDV
ncbi:hypothetical protein I3842_01G157700 [Carya illinoinensis]|uniref:Uncharacterized protein n=1 Tax=Carya illinoinensis TaxID=32201 RepID=A0A922K418_CARIL|nr:hypothetical protein I3842_01G157700 [Carya illinoinensis]